MKLGWNSNVKATDSEAELAHITQEIYKRNLELSERNKTLLLLQHIDEAVLSSTGQLSAVIQTITDLLISEGEFGFASIYLAGKSSSLGTARGFSTSKTIRPERLDLIKNQFGALNLTPSKDNDLSYAMLSGDIQVITSFRGFRPEISEEDDASLKALLEVDTFFICPLKSTGQSLGVMIIGLVKTAASVSEYKMNLIKRLTNSISIAVQNYLLYEELEVASDKLTEQNATLQKLNHLKDDFMSMATHQLGTPMAVVDGYISTVIHPTHGANVNKDELLGKALARLRLMKRLVEDFLNVSRMETGRFIITRTPTDLNKMVEQEVELLAQKAKEENIELKYKKPDHQVPVISIDEQKTRQAIMNLIDNAIYYSPGATVTVSLKSDEQNITFQVEDSGIGIDEESQKNLFTKYYRADNAKKQRPDGSGIGLFLVKKVIQAQGGRLIFNSQLGVGSTFGFILPIKNPPEPEQDIGLPSEPKMQPETEI